MNYLCTLFQEILPESVTIDSNFKDNLAKFEQKLDNLQKDVTDLKIDLTKVTSKVKGLETDIQELKNYQKRQVWSLIWILIWALIGLLTTVTVSIAIYFMVRIFTAKP